MARYDERPFTVMMAFRRTARLMVDELVTNLQADGYRGVRSRRTTRSSRTSIKKGLASATSRHMRRHDPPVDERAVLATLERRGWLIRRPHPTIVAPGSSASRPKGETDDSSGPAPHPRDRTRMAGALAQSRLPRSLAPGPRGRAQAARARRCSLTNPTDGHYHRNPARRERADNKRARSRHSRATGERVLLCANSERPHPLVLVVSALGLAGVRVPERDSDGEPAFPRRYPRCREDHHRPCRAHADSGKPRDERAPRRSGDAQARTAPAVRVVEPWVSR